MAMAKETMYEAEISLVRVDRRHHEALPVLAAEPSLPYPLREGDDPRGHSYSVSPTSRRP
jgi:hypothetical protein